MTFSPGFGKGPNWTSPNYWGYNHQQIFESDVQNPQNRTFTNPCSLRKCLRVTKSPRGTRRAPHAHGVEERQGWEDGGGPKKTTEDGEDLGGWRNGLSWFGQWIGLRDNFNQKAPYLMGKSMVSCKFSLNPIHWFGEQVNWNVCKFYIFVIIWLCTISYTIINYYKLYTILVNRWTL